MKKRFSLLLFLMPSTLFGQTPAAAILNLYNTTPSAPGTQLTSTILANGTVGGFSAWASTGGTLSKLTVGPHNPLCNLPVTLTNGGVSYTPAMLSQSFKMDMSTNFQYWQTSVAGVGSQAVIIFCITVPNTPTNLQDIIPIQDDTNGFNMFVQLDNQSGLVINLERTFSGTQHSTYISLTPGTTYLMEALDDETNGHMQLAVYQSQPPYTQVGITNLAPQIVCPSCSINAIRIGNAETGTSSSFMTIEDLAIIPTGTFPLTPTFNPLWGGIVPPTRATDWSGVGVPGGIPNATNICSTLSSGTTVTLINAAIQSCSTSPGAQGTAANVVFLNAGNYNLSPGISFNGASNVVLRGAGADQTFLVFTGGGDGCHNHAASVCVDQTNNETNWQGGPTNTANWTAGYTVGNTTITLSAHANLKVGYPLFLDQADDASDPGTSSLPLPFVCDDNTITPPCSLENYTGQSQRTHRNNVQQNVVSSCGPSTFGAACTSNTIVLQYPLKMNNWTSAKSPGAWWATAPIFNDGVENLSVDSAGSSGASGTIIYNCLGCWVKGVREKDFAEGAIEVAYSSHATIQDNYFYHNQSSATVAYPAEMFNTSDTLVQNNISQYSPGGFTMVNSGCEGCVIAYNFAINNYYTGSAGWMMPASSQHAPGSDMMLYEGNVGTLLAADVFHGTHNFVTSFRNYWVGGQPKCWSSGTYPTATFAACNNDRLAVLLRSYSRFYNIVANVLGNGTATAYLNNGTEDLAIYSIGNGNTETVTVPSDSLVASTLLRWGNYDTFNAANQFTAGEVPTGINLYAAFSPPQTFPNSFYLSAKPSWFRSVPWPPIGPDVAGGNVSGVGGHANLNPAQDCYLNVMAGPADGTGSVLTFNASTCYSGTQPPAPATAIFAASMTVNPAGASISKEKKYETATRIGTTDFVLRFVF